MDHDESKNHPLDKNGPGLNPIYYSRHNRSDDHSNHPFLEAPIGGLGRPYLHQETLNIVDGIRVSCARPRSVLLLPAIEESMNEDKEDFGPSGSRSASSILSSRLFLSGRVSCKPALTSISEERLSRSSDFTSHDAEGEKILLKRSKAHGEKSKRGFSHGYGDVAAYVRQRCEKLMEPEKLQELVPQVEVSLGKSPLVAQAGGEGMVARDDRAYGAAVEGEENNKPLKHQEASSLLGSNDDSDGKDYSDNYRSPERKEELTSSSVDLQPADLETELQGNWQPQGSPRAVEDADRDLPSNSQELSVPSPSRSFNHNLFLEEADSIDDCVYYTCLSIKEEEDSDQFDKTLYILGEEQPFPSDSRRQNFSGLNSYIDYILDISISQVMANAPLEDNEVALETNNNLREYGCNSGESGRQLANALSSSAARTKGSGSESIISGSGDVSAARESHSEHTAAGSASSERQDKGFKDKDPQETERQGHCR